MHGEIWADLQDAWAVGCEDVFNVVSGWTDVMWSRVQDVDASPQVVGAGLGFPDHVIEFHKGGAVQMNLKTNARRSVRRVDVVMGSGKGTVCKDPVNVFYLPGGGPVQVPATSSAHLCASHQNPYEDPEPLEQRFNPFAAGHSTGHEDEDFNPFAAGFSAGHEDEEIATEARGASSSRA